MALINCPECNKELSNTAKTCPHCGFSVKKKNKNNKLIVALSTIGLIALIGLFISKGIFYGRPNGMSQQAYDYGLDAIRVVDNYLDAAYNYDTTSAKLDDISSALEILYDKDDDVDTFALQMDVFILSNSLSVGTDSDIVNKRNKLASELNEKKR